jgi:hypothetical protein
MSLESIVGPGTRLGYCTNVHAGADLEQTLANLDHYAAAVKAQASPSEPMGLGLWLSASAARQVVREQRAAELRDWLAERGLAVFTLNGFPYGDFHGSVVKHRVYSPNWSQRERFDYTCDLIEILATLLPEEAEGSISTLPVGWASDFPSEAALEAGAYWLTEVVHRLARTELDTGRYIHLDLEPEPGCALDTSDGVVTFFQRWLLGSADERSVRAYLQVCHDVCHAAVMREEQAAALSRYREAGVGVGKVQLSSAIAAPFERLDEPERAAAWDQLRQFDEPRYLHQTTVRQNGTVQFYEDLGQALTAAEQTVGNGAFTFTCPCSWTVSASFRRRRRRWRRVWLRSNRATACGISRRRLTRGRSCRRRFSLVIWPADWRRNWRG